MDEEQLIELLAKTSGKPFADIHLSSKLDEDLGLCSFDIMVLVYSIESKTDYSVDVKQLSLNRSVEGLLSAISLKRE